MKNVALYIRVSTDMQLELSPDSQRELLLDYCKNHDYIVTDNDIFQDLGISGRKVEKRPAFNEMIALCKSKEHPYDAIIVWKFSRFARNQEESVIYKRMLKKIGVDVISVSEPISDDIGGRIAESIFEIMDEYYSINLSQEVTRGMKENAKRGVHQCRPPYGYDKIGKNEFQKNDGAIVVKRIFDAYLGGLGLTSIAIQLNEDMIPSPSKNKKWTKAMVKYILLNPFYCGLIRWNYRSGGRTNSCSIKDESEWIIREGTHDPIIDRKSWEKIDSDFNERRKPTPNAERNNYKHWLGGLVKCAYCGKNMCHESIKSKDKKRINHYYICSGKKQGICTHSQRTKVEDMEKYFFDYFENIDITKIKKNTVTVNNDPLLEILEKQLADISKKEERIKRAYMDGIDTIEEYKSNKQIILAEKEKLVSKIESIKSNSNKIEGENIDKKSIDNLIDLLKSDDISVSDKNEKLRELIDKIVYDKDNQTIDFYFLQ